MKKILRNKLDVITDISNDNYEKICKAYSTTPENRNKLFVSLQSALKSNQFPRTPERLLQVNKILDLVEQDGIDVQTVRWILNNKI